MSSTSPHPMGSSGKSLTIRPSSTASLGGLPLNVSRSVSASSLSSASVPDPQPTPVPAPAPVVRTSFVLSSSRSRHLRLLSPEAIARHALGSPVLPVRGPPRLAEGFIPFPAPTPSPADDPRVVFANTTPDTHRIPSRSSDSGSGSKSAYGSGYVAHGNGAGPGPSTTAAWRGAGRLSTIQEGSTHKSSSPAASVISAPPALEPLSRQSSIATSDAASVSTSAASVVSDVSDSTDISSTRSSSSRSSQRPWVPSRTRGRSVDHSLSFADFKSWSVRSEDFGRPEADARRLNGNGVDAGSTSNSGSGTTGPLSETVRERGEEDEFGRELDELESVVSDMSEKLATLHFVGREAPETGDDEVSPDKGKGRERGEVRRERREARRVAEQLPASPNKSANRPSSSRRPSSSASSAISGRSIRAGPVPPLVFSAS